MTIKNLFFVLMGSLLIINCSSTGGDDLVGTDPTPNPDPDTTTKITYDANIKSIISNNCNSCHGNPPTNGAPTSYTTFSQVSGNVDGILSRINNASSPMPPQGLMPQSTRALIQQWKDEGLLEN